MQNVFRWKKRETGMEKRQNKKHWTIMGNDNFYQHYKDQEQQQREQYKESFAHAEEHAKEHA